MQQRALIDTGEEPPTPQALAELGTGLAVQYGWSLNGVAPINGARVIKERKPAELAAAERRAKDRERKRKGRGKWTVDRSDPPKEERMGMMIEWVRQHPRSSLPEIVAGCGYVPERNRIGRWTHQIRELVTAGILTSAVREGAHGRLKEYTLAERPNENEEP